MSTALENDLTGGPGQQRIARRSPIFVFLPALAFSFFCGNLVWEVIRLNVSATARTSLPFQVSLLSAESAATLATAVGGMIFARSQFARTHRPSLGFSVEGDDATSEISSQYWFLRFFNGGPGHAVVVSAVYRATFEDHDGAQTRTEWLRPPDMRQVLTTRGLVIGKDFGLQWLGKGAPLVPCARAADGMVLARFGLTALGQLREFSVKIVVEDRVGDRHEREFDAYYHLPAEVKTGAPAVGDIEPARRSY